MENNVEVKSYNLNTGTLSSIKTWLNNNRSSNNFLIRYSIKSIYFIRNVIYNIKKIFTNKEYEAMSILDKTAEEYENMTKYRSHLSTILKMSSDIAFTVARERYKKSLGNG